MSAKEIQVTDQNNLNIHLLQGVTIEHTGDAAVDSYFKPTTTGNVVDGHEVLAAGFRGRHMRGIELPLPEGYTGTVLTCSADPEKDGKVWTASGKFDKMHYWNHDNPPLKGDGVRRCFEWATLAQQIHKPIDIASE